MQIDGDSVSLLPSIQPRVAIAVSYNALDSDEVPYFSRDHLPLPPLALRLAIACAQRLRLYRSESIAPGEDVALMWECFYNQLTQFDQNYARKLCRCEPVQPVIRAGGADRYGDIRKVMPAFF
jgi:hypothetical protein